MIKITTEGNSNLFSEFDFLSGDVRWVDEYRQEDMLLVLYPNNYIFEMGWYDGIEKYVINIIKDYETGVPVAKYTASTEENIKLLLQEAIGKIESESQNARPYYGGLWKTEEKEL